METKMKRFTISVTDEMKEELDYIKQSRYDNTTQNKMLQELIKLGIESARQTIQDETDYPIDA